MFLVLCFTFSVKLDVRTYIYTFISLLAVSPVLCSYLIWIRPPSQQPDCWGLRACKVRHFSESLLSSCKVKNNLKGGHKPAQPWEMHLKQPCMRIHRLPYNPKNASQNLTAQWDLIYETSEFPHCRELRPGMDQSHITLKKLKITTMRERMGKWTVKN